MYKIKTLNKISPVGLAVLDKDRFQVSEDITDPDAILVRSADMLSYEFNESLRCIGRAGAGTNNIPSDRCTETGIVVFNSPGGNSQAVKELAIAALLLASRNIVGGIEWVKSIADQGDEVAKLVEKGKSKFVGPEIAGKTLGVIGLGAVGIKLANAAVDLGMNVMGYDPFLSVDAAFSISSSIKHVTDLETIYRNCDYISIHVPLTADTRGMINSDSISLMKGNVRIINIARGELVNDDDMIEALKTGRVASYVTDFPNGKTANVPGVVAIPHLGASTPESEDTCAVMAAREIAEYLNHGNIVNSVNMPNVSMERSGSARLCVFHKNVPNMIGSIVGVIAGENINVTNMVNKSRGEIAYSMLDLDSRIRENVIDEINALNGVIRVRVLQY